MSQLAFMKLPWGYTNIKRLNYVQKKFGGVDSSLKITIFRKCSQGIMIMEIINRNNNSLEIIIISINGNFCTRYVKGLSPNFASNAKRI